MCPAEKNIIKIPVVRCCHGNLCSINQLTGGYPIHWVGLVIDVFFSIGWISAYTEEDIIGEQTGPFFHGAQIYSLVEIPGFYNKLSVILDS